MFKLSQKIKGLIIDRVSNVPIHENTLRDMLKQAQELEAQIKSMEKASNKLWDSITDIVSDKQISTLEHLHLEELKTLGVI